MVGLLNSRNPKVLAIVTDCLHILAFNNEEVKIIIESSDGPQQLLRLLETTDYEKLLWTTTRLLRVLSVSPSIKIVLVSKNAIRILEKQLAQPKSLRVQQNCLQMLRNLSDQAVKLVRIDRSMAKTKHGFLFLRLGKSRFASPSVDSIFAKQRFDSRLVFRRHRLESDL